MFHCQLTRTSLIFIWMIDNYSVSFKLGTSPESSRLIQRKFPGRFNVKENAPDKKIPKEQTQGENKLVSLN